MATGEGSKSFPIHPVPVNRAIITVEELTPLIVNKFSEKAKREIEDKQTGKKAKAREARNPEQIFRDSLHVVPGMEDAEDEPGKFCFPAIGFKASIVRGIGLLRLGKDLSMLAAKTAFFVDRDPVLQFDELVMRRDYVKLSTTSSLTYRGEFHGWGADLEVSYWPHLISLEQLVNATNAAGYGVGVGEWRPLPSKGASGIHGRFRVVGVTELERA